MENQPSTPPIETTPPTPTPTPTPTPLPTAVNPDAETAVEAEEKSEKIQWITLLILGLSITSLIMSIINSKKQIENLEKGDEGRDKDIKEVKFNLKKLMGNKYETIDG
jgi:hypothetical protein